MRFEDVKTNFSIESRDLSIVTNILSENPRNLPLRVHRPSKNDFFAEHMIKNLKQKFSTEEKLTWRQKGPFTMTFAPEPGLGKEPKQPASSQQSFRSARSHCCNTPSPTFSTVTWVYNMNRKNFRYAKKVRRQKGLLKLTSQIPVMICNRL
jgi:hypothetical protein